MVSCNIPWGLCSEERWCVVYVGRRLLLQMGIITDVLYSFVVSDSLEGVLEFSRRVRW